MAQAELLWALLDAVDLDGLKKLDLQHIDWGMLHPTRGITLLVEGIVTLFVVKKQDLKVINWLISHGASTVQKCSSRTRTGFSHSLQGNENTKVEVSYAGHSAISFVVELRNKFREKDPHYEAEIAFLGKVLNLFASASSEQGCRPRVSIDEGIATLWEKYLMAKDSHDVTIEAADGSVTAHAQMLKEASPVVRAMLVSPMRESRARHIQVKDTSQSAVSLFLETLGSKRAETKSFCFLFGLFPLLDSV